MEPGRVSGSLARLLTLLSVVSPYTPAAPGRRAPSALPPVEEGQFQEVKTGVVILPNERVETSPGRHSVVRRLLVSCLGNADTIFAGLYARLRELGWSVHTCRGTCLGRGPVALRGRIAVGRTLGPSDGRRPARR